MRELLGGRKNFEKRVKIRAIAGGILALLGVVSVNIVWSCKVPSDSWTFGFYAGLGGGLTGAGLITMVKNIRLLKDPIRLSAVRNMEYDERNLYLRDKSMVITGMIMILGMYLATIIFGVIKPELSQVLLTIMGISLAVFVVVNLVIRKAE